MDKIIINKKLTNVSGYTTNVTKGWRKRNSETVINVKKSNKKIPIAIKI